MERNAGCAEDDQKKMASSEYSNPVLKDTRAVLNFSELSPCHFGISVQSFAPASNSKDKLRLAQIKARRRSSVGVRGSPETNSLIRFMAQQRMKTPPSCQTPELVRSGPVCPRVATMLRQKMASFQNLMDVEESEVCHLKSDRDCNKTRDNLSDSDSFDKKKREKENNPVKMTPTRRKRRRFDPPETCELEIRDTKASVLHFSSKAQEEEEVATQGMMQAPLPSYEGSQTNQAVPISTPLHVASERRFSSPPKDQKGDIFELQSLWQPPSSKSAAAPPSQISSSLHIPSLPSQLDMKSTGEDVCAGKPTVGNKKKSVHFGGPLSPEFFDKNLPPSTPLQKGGMPARAPTPGGNLNLRSVLKTPQRSDMETTQAQTDLSSPTVFGASPILKMPQNHRMNPVGEDSEETEGKIIFPSLEEIDSDAMPDSERMFDTQPLNLNNAFNEESLSQTLTEFETKPNATSVMDQLMPSNSDKQLEAATEAAAQPRTRRRKQQAAESVSTTEAPARSSSAMGKQPEDSEPVKRLTRSAAKSASGKIKTSIATRRWNKDVDRSLYSSREYASKNPTLSPIKERLSFNMQQSPAAQQTGSASCIVSSDKETDLNPEMPMDNQIADEPTERNAPESPSIDPVISFTSSKESAMGSDEGLTGLKQRKVSVSDDVLGDSQESPGEKMDKLCEDSSSPKPDSSQETLLAHIIPEQGEVSSKLDSQTSDVTLEGHGNLDTPSSAQSASASQRKAMRGRSSSNNSLQHQTAYEEESNQPKMLTSSSESQDEGGAPGLDLAPWQADFNFEDVFKPVATRGQRAVRRSLRNQSNTEHSSVTGLAWVPRTSPDSRRELRRRTRGRRLSAAPPVQPSLPEERQDIVL